MSMQHGVEVRLPYLSREVVRLAQGIPSTTRLSHGKKWILKQILNDLEGAQFARRPKEGFGLPLGSWIRNRKHAYLWDPLTDSNSIIFNFVDKNDVDGIMARHLKRQVDFSQEIWALMVLAHWLRRTFD
jgi:asparagine synthase (glutamine-hydrolysing)